MPEGARVEYVVTPDGVRLRAALWRPLMSDNGKVVLLLQGRTEFIERYAETVSSLLTRGFHVVAFDWRGQGGSERMLPNPAKGHVEHFDDYLLDLHTVITSVIEPLGDMPRIALAHSMGGAVLMHALQRDANAFEHCVLSAPMIGLSMVKRPKMVHFAARALKVLGFSARYVPGGTDGATFEFLDNPLTRDEARHSIARKVFRVAPELAIGSPTIGWASTSFDAMAALQDPSFPASITTPILVVAGPDDRITSTPMAQSFAARLPNGRFLAIPGSEHEVLLEIEPVRLAFWEAFDGFVR
jgi:lysophospholipase